MFLLILPTTAAAADNTCSWNGSEDNDWFTAANWHNCNGGIPGVGDTAVISSGHPIINTTTGVGSLTTSTSTNLTIEAGATLAVADTFTQRGAINGDGDLTINGDWLWLRGDHDDNGQTTIAATAVLTISYEAGNNQPRLNRTILNQGSIVWNAGNISSLTFGGGLIINNGSFTVTHDGIYSHAQFENQASFVKTIHSGEVRFSTGRFTNQGTVEVETGTLNIMGSHLLPDPVDSGSYTVADGALLAFGGVITRILTTTASISAPEVLFAGVTVDIYGSYDVMTTTTTLALGRVNWYGADPRTLPVVDLGGGSLGGDAPLLIGRQFDWRVGSINGTTPLTITAGATFSLMLAASQQLNRTVVNEGTAVWSSGNLSGQGIFINNGALTASHSGNALAHFISFVNNGRFTKTGGSGQLSFESNPILQNKGEIHVDSGTLRLWNGLDNYADNTLTGGSYIISGTLQIQSANLIYNEADLALHTANAAVQDSAGNDALANFAENGTNGRFALRYGAAITLPHAFMNSGELVAGPAGLFASQGFTQTGSTATVTIELANSPASGLYGKIEAGPETTLAGTFQVAYRDGFIPGEMDSYEVMSFAKRNGNFGAFAGLSIDGTQIVTVVVSPTNVLINSQGVDPVTQAPQAGFSSNSPVTLGAMAVFTNTTTGDDPISYEWDFGDGSPLVTTPNPTHTYTAPGNYTVMVTATNAGGSDVHQTQFVVQSVEEPEQEYWLYLPTLVKP